VQGLAFIAFNVLASVSCLDSGNLVHIMSRNANDRGRFVVIKTRLTTKEGEECKKREDYIHVARG
jgi:hypothetical protein